MDDNPAQSRFDLPVFDVPASLANFVDAALVRLNYLHTGTNFDLKNGVIWVHSSLRVDEPAIRSEVAHALYREKIYAETLDLRRAIYRGIFER